MGISTLDKVIIYSEGIFYCSVCADASLTPEEVQARVNLERHPGTTAGWVIADEPFRCGAPNPSPCNEHEGRLHYLLVC
jgi:hypothetical protein